MFWIQVHDITIRYMITEVAENICDIICEVVRSIGAETEEGSSFIRVRIKLDISLPLCRGRVITLDNGEKTWVAFKCERLPNFCFWRGRLSHSDKDFPLWIQSRGMLKDEDRKFGASL